MFDMLKDTQNYSSSQFNAAPSLEKLYQAVGGSSLTIFVTDCL